MKVKQWKRILAGLLVACVAWCGMPALSVSAEEGDSTISTYSSPAANTVETPATAFTDKVEDGAITVDGVLDEPIWSTMNYAVDRRVVSTTLNNTCNFSTAWDSENFYVGITVKDETIVEDLLDPLVYMNDGVEIFLDPNNDGVYDEHTAHFMIQVANGQWKIMGGVNKWDYIEETSYLNSEIKCARIDGGYTVELKVPFADMGLDAPQQGQALGLAVCNNDNDNSTQIDRSELHWVEDFSAGDAATWGTAYLNSETAQMVSDHGSPAVDGDLNDWTMGDKKVTKKNGSDFFSVSYGSMCDTEYLYLAYEIELLDGTTFEDEIYHGTKAQEFTLFLSGDNDQLEDGRSPNNHDVDLSFDMHEGYLLSGGNTQLDTCDSDPETEGVQRAWPNRADAKVGNIAEGNVRKVEIAIPWSLLGKTPEYLSVVGMETVITINQYQVKWSGGGYWSYSAGYGTVVLNSKNLTVTNNAPTAPNQINSYSIAQGESLSGKIHVTDADGDPLTYTLVEPFASDSDGSFELNTSTGEWTYTPPSDDLIKPEGVNYFVETSDGQASFRSRIEIRIEHTPTYLTYHVDGDNGNDNNDGLTKETAFKTIEKAHSVTNPGDTVLIYDSTVPYGYYENYVRDGIILTRSGLPDAYITYKAAPDNHPVVKSNLGWNTIQINGSYIKLEGLTIEGMADEVTYEQAWAVFRSKAPDATEDEKNDSWDEEISLSNTNGINITPAKRITKDETVTLDNLFIPHHVEVRNCVVDKVSAGGLSAIEADYIVFENNTVTNCCWWDMYGSSAISVLFSMDIDGATEEHKVVIRNNIAAGTRHFIKWVSLNPPRLSDGNGIIVDSNAHAQEEGILPYSGRTLVANNLVYENGGSGMHVFDSNHVDMINNTVYSNVACVSLGYSDFYASQANDVNMFNNIVYSRSGNKMNITQSSNSQVAYDNNLFFNYDPNNNNIGEAFKGTTVGENNLFPVDPLFVNAPVIDNEANASNYPDSWTEDMKVNAANARFDPTKNYDINQYEVDFTLQENSPALNAGNTDWFALVGNEDNRLGIFGTVGANLAVSEEPENPDSEKPDDSSSEEPESPSSEVPDDSSSENPDGSENPETPSSQVSDTSKPTDTNPTTGSSITLSMILGSALLFILSGGAVLTMLVSKYRRKSDE